MRIAVCIEKSGGMLFNGRRVGRDLAVTEKVAELAGEGQIFLNTYSAKLFEGSRETEICENFTEAATEADICFIENVDIPIESVTEIFLFKWNRNYPADVYFSYDLKALGFKKVKTEDFAGNAHKKITLERYVKKEV